MYKPPQMTKMMQKMNIRNIVMAAMITALSGCVTLTDDEGHEGAFSPTPLFLRNLPQTEDAYSVGFRDGCYNFIGQNGYGLQRLYDRPANPDNGFLTNPLYQEGYSHGDRYCGVYVNRDIIL